MPDGRFCIRLRRGEVKVESTTGIGEDVWEIGGEADAGAGYRSAGSIPDALP